MNVPHIKDSARKWVQIFEVSDGRDASLQQRWSFTVQGMAGNETQQQREQFWNDRDSFQQKV